SVFVVTAAHCVVNGAGTRREGWSDQFAVEFSQAQTGQGANPDNLRAAELLALHEQYTGKPGAGGPYRWDDDGDGRPDVTTGNFDDVAILRLLPSLPGQPAPSSLLPSGFAATEIAPVDLGPGVGQQLLALGYGLGGAIDAGAGGGQATVSEPQV